VATPNLGPSDLSASPCPLAVVMPTRNQAAFLAAAVDSVFAQGVPGLRLFVQDGASTDDTPALLAALAQRHPGLHWVSEPDTGPADALNRAFARALAACGAPVFGWLNSDDLYTPGAAQRVLAHFAAHAADVAVYGEGEHVDAAGQRLGAYPTQPPSWPLERWRDGCPICQPTMFLRREALKALLPLDTGLRTAFDFELWLRLFKSYGGHIGHLPAVQAQSRLHDAGITLRLREQVAMECMEVAHRHLGSAPGHWLVTHVGEAIATCPFDADAVAVQHHLLELADRAAPWLGPGGAEALKQEMQSSLPWRLLQPHFAASVQADGWAGPRLELRLRQPEPPGEPVGLLRLHGRHAWPRPGRVRLRLTAWHEGRPVAAKTAWWRQAFVLDIPVAERAPGARLVFEVRASDAFVPADVLPGSRDMRPLAFRVEAVQPLPGA
jgi:hypothetical protein